MNNNSEKGIFRKIVGAKEFTLIIALALSITVFWLINKNYLSTNNIRNIFNSAFVMGILAVGTACLLIGGKIDLSSGNTGMLAGIMLSLLLKAGYPWVPSFFLILLFGVATGLMNAFFVNGLKFAPFISTLAVSAVYNGFALILTKAQNMPISTADYPGFIKLGTLNLGIFPLPFSIMVVLLAIYGVILYFTGFGRRIYMTGGNANAARLAGINTRRITTILFANNSALACLAGMLFASRMNMASPTSVTGSDLDAITAVILGGVAFTGGTGGMFGVFIGIILLTSFQNGLVVGGLDSYYQVVAKGVLLIAALILDYYRENARLKSLKTGETAKEERS